MFMRKVLVSALFAAGMIGAVATPLPSEAARAEIRVDVAPPPPRDEAVPRPRKGHIWSPGHWQWNQKRHKYVWAKGHWEKARHGYAYRAPEWVERDGRWHYQPSRWDRDGDGTPDRSDRRPNDPTRR
jgi:hypothetical protein